MSREKNANLQAVARKLRDATAMSAAMKVTYDTAEQSRASLHAEIATGIAVLEDANKQFVKVHVTECEMSPCDVHVVIAKKREPRRCYYCNADESVVEFKPATMEAAIAAQNAQAAAALAADET